jgi:hypothetical protein
MLRCPICRRKTQWEDNPWRPFCSQRCQVIDLGAWAAGVYRIPSTDDQVEAPEPSQDASGDA